MHDDRKHEWGLETCVCRYLEGTGLIWTHNDKVVYSWTETYGIEEEKEEKRRES